MEKEHPEFFPGSTICFLPLTCAIRLEPPRWDFEGTSPDEPPQWTPILGPQTKVGMSMDRALKRTVNLSSGQTILAEDGFLS
jgi:hypothetical protein